MKRAFRILAITVMMAFISSAANAYYYLTGGLEGVTGGVHGGGCFKFWVQVHEQYTDGAGTTTNKIVGEFHGQCGDCGGRIFPNGCPSDPVVIGDDTFTTDSTSPGCASDYLMVDSIYALYAAIRSDILNGNGPQARKARPDQSAIISAFPNPATKILSIWLHMPSVSNHFVLSFIDINGRNVRKQDFLGDYTNSVYAMDVSDLARGSYQVLIADDRNIIATQRVLLK